jgi:hypothetical protein
LALKPVDCASGWRASAFSAAAAHIGRAIVGTETDVVVATFWESIDSVKAFAGESYEKAVVEPIVHEFLERFDDEVAHFTVASTVELPDRL